MKKNVLTKWLAMTLALTMTFSASGMAVLAAEESAGAAIAEAAGEEVAAAEAEAAQEAESAEGAAEGNAADEAAGAAASEDAAAEAADETAAEAADAADDTAAEAADETAADAADETKAEAADEDAAAEAAEAGENGEADEADQAAEAEEPAELTEEAEALGEANALTLDAQAEAAVIEASKIEIAGAEYAYADVSGAAEGAEVKITVDGEEHALADFTAIGETGIVYYSANPLSGSLYGTDPAQVTSYTDFYASKGVSASGADYDVISSATAFSGHHVKDIPAIIARNDNGIVGVYDSVSVDAKTYAEAKILTEAGKTLSEEQAKAAAVTLNEDPTKDPEAADKKVEIKTASYGYTCKYGDGEFILNPDDSVDGFVWSDYKNALYAAVISDGSNNAGAVWWTDLYGESATTGPHYNKVEIAVNNGTSKGSNGATVNRYASMYNSAKQELKAGTYTVTLYARGYNTVSADVEVLSSFDGEVKAALSADKKAVELTGTEELKDAKVTVSRTEGSGRQAQTFYYAQDAEIADGKVALDTSENELVYATYNVTITSSNYAPVTVTFEIAYSGYVLMNIPYSAFYGAESASVADVDAVSSATNKTGNYNFAGGAYHSGKTEQDGQAVGGENGSKMQGVTWAVKAESLDDAKALGGEEVTDASSVVTATAAHGNVSTQTLVGYQALTEKPSYSYYVLAEEPSNYLVLGGGSFTSASKAQDMGSADTDVIYGGHWGDVQVNVTAADISDKLVDAIVFTADDGTKVGMYHLDQIWRSGAQMAWMKNVVDSLDGKTITGVTYYCMTKDADLTDGAAPAYANYVYNYTTDAKINKIYTGEVSAEFNSAAQITVKGIPADAQNVKAKVYEVISMRPVVYAYLTPVEVDSATDAFVPVEVDVKSGKIAITKGSVTNAAGTEQKYGEPELDKEYTIVLTSDNYGDITTTATFKEIPIVLGKTTRGDMFNLANNVKVTWKAVPGAKYYKVYRSGVKEPVIVTTGLVGWDNVKSPALVNGQKYTYTIVASTTGKGDSSGDSPVSYSKVMYRLKTVAIKSVKNTAAGKATVKYNKSATGDSYVLQYADNKEMKNAKTIVINGANTTSKVIGGLKKGKTYYFQIRVRKKVGGILYYTTFGVVKSVKITK